MKWEHLSPRFIELKSTQITSTGCWEWMGYVQSSGYGQIWIENKPTLAHRLSWILHKGEIPPRIRVLHKCDRRRCVNPEHLFLGTHQDNMNDCIAKGRAGFQKHGHDFTRKKRIRKLTDDQVRKIRNSKLPPQILSAMFDVSQSHISFIRSGKRKQLVV